MKSDVMRKLAKPMLFFAALIWGTSFFIMKNTLDVIPAFYLLAIRFGSGAILLSVIFWRKWEAFDLSYLWCGAVNGGFMFVAYVFQTFGLLETTPSKNAFLTSVYCVIVPFLYWLTAKQRPDRYNIAAAVLCVAGVGLVSLSGELTVNRGDVLTLLCAPFFAAQIVSFAIFSKGRDVYLLTIFEFASYALFALACALLTEPFPGRAMLEPAALVPVIYLCVMVTTVAFLFQNLGQFWSDPSSASVILSLESVFGVICSVLFYGDQVTLQMMVGFVLIFVAVICSETKFSFLRKTADN